jgi:hypothetical protein
LCQIENPERHERKIQFADGIDVKKILFIKPRVLLKRYHFASFLM